MTMKHRIGRLESGSRYTTIEALIKQLDAEEAGENVEPLSTPLHPQLVRFLERNER
ncbi:hypothetical protein [Marinicauda pacifica]|uniref:hypothetical protein n=1 Tax=Marinicauda pacifica TaxID=1133559 RepID=UPI0035C80EF2